MSIEFGIDSFGDLPRDERGTIMSHAAAIRATVDEAVLADQIGIDVVSLGEHHRPEYAISSPETVLAGIATRTSRIRLASGVTVLSSDDPVRVYQRFATVDALSHGRAEVILGRGSFRFLASISRITTSCLRRRSICLTGFSRRSRYLGKGRPGRRWTVRRCFQRPNPGG
jgi:hypothetical protein